LKPTIRQPGFLLADSLLSPLAGTAILIAGLYYGRPVLIPFALALLFSFLLTPLVTWLERANLGRSVSVGLVLVVASAALSALLWLGLTQLADIVSMYPSYQENIHRKIDAMRNPAGSALSKAVDSVADLSAELAQPSQTPSRSESLPSRKSKRKTSTQGTPEGPIRVQVVKGQPEMLDSIGLVGMSVVHFAEQAGGVFIFTLFMLMQRSDLLNRLFRLLGQGHLNIMTAALDDAARRVSRYLFTQSLINGTFGLLLGFGLYWIGVPNAPFWGVLGAVLRFVPYIGSLISGICPLILALAVFEGWQRPLFTFGLFAGLEIVLSSAIEPWLYGAHTGLSSLAILISAAFWTLLWGPIGLILSTPLTVCLLVVGRYVPSLSSLAILLGDEPVLPPEACYYQRLLAGDEEEAQDIAMTYLKDHPVDELYESVLIPALSLAEKDRHDETLDEDRAEYIYQSSKTLIDDLESPAPDNNAHPGERPQRIVCLPARDKADELAAIMLCQVLARSGWSVSVIPVAPVEEMLIELRRRAPDVVFVSALPPLAVSHARCATAFGDHSTV
jgi:predicted PurR-regulated permease PerM